MHFFFFLNAWCFSGDLKAFEKCLMTTVTRGSVLCLESNAVRANCFHHQDHGTDQGKKQPNACTPAVDFSLRPPTQCQDVWSFLVTQALDMKQCNGGKRKRGDLVSCQTSCTHKAISVDRSQPGLHFSEWAKDERFSVPVGNPQSHPFTLSYVHYQKLLFKAEQKLLCCIKLTKLIVCSMFPLP